MPWKLTNDPDWHAAAQTLINEIAAADSSEIRVQLLERVCLNLGDNLYPAFLNILCVVGEFGDHKAQTLISQSLVHALTTGRLPSGKLSAWGADTYSSKNALSQTRSLGPIEYLCIWYAQPVGSQSLSAAAFHRIACTLVSLISIDSKARQLYCAKLRADVDDPIEGTLSRPTRQALGEMIVAWESGSSPDNVVSCFQNVLHGGGLTNLASLTPSLLR